MSALTEKIDAAREGASERAAKLPDSDALKKKLAALRERLDEAKRKIVATKEGGAITGEERIREHLDLLYGALMTWEGKPAKYQLERIDALKHELEDVGREFASIAQNDVRPLDDELRRRHLDPIPTTAVARDDDEAPATEAAFRCLQSRGDDCPAESSPALDRR
jgi:hypothetical protein